MLLERDDMVAVIPEGTPSRDEGELRTISYGHSTSVWKSKNP